MCSDRNGLSPRRDSAACSPGCVGTVEWGCPAKPVMLGGEWGWP